MLTRQELLLLVSFVHFVEVRAVITKNLAPYMCIIKIFGACDAIHQTSMYGLFGVRSWRKMALESVSPWLT